MKNRTYLDKVLEELQIVPKSQEQRKELESVLFRKLCYPSTELARLHMKSDRLGCLDQIQKKQDQNETEQQKASKQGLKKCKCCGLYWQEKSVSMWTSLSKIRDVGISSRLFFVSLVHISGGFFVMFLIYCIYAIISNVKSCNYDSDNLLPEFTSAKAMSLVSSWIFNFSLISNISCMQSSRAYEIQAWLGLAMIIVVSGILAILKFRKFKVLDDLKKERNSVRNLTVLIQNLPIDLNKQKLEEKFKNFQKSFTNLKPHLAKEISIAKINRAAPFYLSTSLFSSKEANAASQRYEDSKKSLVKLIKYRISNEEFEFDKVKRQEIYDQFQKAKKNRIQVFEKTILESLLQKKQESEDKVLTSPAFVTFESNFNKQFILKYHENYLGKNFIHFQRSKKTVTRAIIQDAPAPEQIIWTNIGQEHSVVLRKKILIYIITIILLVGTGVGLYYLQLSNFEYAVKNQGKRSTLVLSLIVAIVILIITYINSAILMILSVKERNMTYMQQQASLSHKVIVCQIGHFIIVPLIFNLALKVRYTGVISLSQTVFFLSLQSAFIFPFLKFFDPICLAHNIAKLLSRRPKNKLSKIQKQLNKSNEHMQFGIGFQFSYLIRSILFTCFYAPLQPIIVLFAIGGMFVTYWVFKYCLLHRSSRPVSGNRLINVFLNRYSGVGPILFAIGSLVWPYYIAKQFYGLVPCILQIVFSTLIYILPKQGIIANIFRKAKSQQKQQPKQILYSENRYDFQYEYDRLNYMTAHEANLEYFRQQNKNTGSLDFMSLVANIISQINIQSPYNDPAVKLNQQAATQPQKTHQKTPQQLTQQAQQSIVYAPQANDNANLIKSILQYIKDNINVLCQPGSMGSAENLRSRHSFTMENQNNNKSKTQDNFLNAIMQVARNQEGKDNVQNTKI